VQSIFDLRADFHPLQYRKWWIKYQFCDKPENRKEWVAVIGCPLRHEEGAQFECISLLQHNNILKRSIE
jgi:hypothetical protein